MKIARATKEDFRLVVDFMNFVEEFMDYGTCSDGDDEDSQEVSDERFVALLREKWGRRFGPALVDAAWRRVILGGQAAIENACDETLDHLDFKPEIKAAVEAFEKAKGGAK